MGILQGHGDLTRTWGIGDLQGHGDLTRTWGSYTDMGITVNRYYMRNAFTCIENNLFQLLSRNITTMVIILFLNIYDRNFICVCAHAPSSLLMSANNYSYFEFCYILFLYRSSFSPLKRPTH